MLQIGADEIQPFAAIDLIHAPAAATTATTTAPVAAIATLFLRGGRARRFITGVVALGFDVSAVFASATTSAPTTAAAAAAPFAFAIAFRGSRCGARCALFGFVVFALGALRLDLIIACEFFRLDFRRATTAIVRRLVSLGGVFFKGVAADVDFEIARVHAFPGDHSHADVAVLFNRGKRIALFVEQVERDFS
ncbi:MAG TPA: hypothetical protein PLV92_25190, partial [Pirellulaceae bacterium]|nr:hypothetical protein [Pirellulaceae bacterium]